MTVPARFVIYSDLDGCLLDRESYRFDEVRPVLELLRRQGIPLVLCSSKTWAEVEYHREILGLAHPFKATSPSPTPLRAAQGGTAWLSSASRTPPRRGPS